MFFSLLGAFTKFRKLLLGFVMFVCSSDRPSICVSVRLSVCPPVRPTVRLSVCVSVCPSDRPSVYLCVCPSVHPSVRPSVYLCVCPSVRPTVRLSVCVSVCPSVRPSVRLSVCVSVCPSDRPSVYLCVCLSVCPPAWSNSTPTRQIVMKFGIWRFFEICWENLSLMKIWREQRAIHMKIHTHLLYCFAELFLEREVFQTKVVHKNKMFYGAYVFYESRAADEITVKHGTTRRPTWQCMYVI
jgi:hypothetical protein